MEGMRGIDRGEVGWMVSRWPWAAQRCRWRLRDNARKIVRSKNAMLHM